MRHFRFQLRKFSADNMFKNVPTGTLYSFLKNLSADCLLFPMVPHWSFSVPLKQFHAILLYPREQSVTCLCCQVGSCLREEEAISKVYLPNCSQDKVISLGQCLYFLDNHQHFITLYSLTDNLGAFPGKTARAALPCPASVCIILGFTCLDLAHGEFFFFFTLSRQQENFTDLFVISHWLGIVKVPVQKHTGQPCFFPSTKGLDIQCGFPTRQEDQYSAKPGSVSFGNSS